MELEKALWRIKESYEPGLALEKVLPDVQSQINFTSVLSKLSKLGDISLGGRRLRELMGCKTIDLADSVVNDAHDLEFVHQIRLGPLNLILREFPTERMKKPDVDFFTTNLNSKQIIEALTEEGFIATCDNHAAGGINVVEMETPFGKVTFTDSEESWQTQPPWPMYAAVAQFNNESNKFELNAGYGRMYMYPLEFSGVGLPDKNSMDPKLFAAVGRILLWSLTATTPKGESLEVPCANSQEIIFGVVEHLYDLVVKMHDDPELKKKYRVAVRDMAIALRIIELSDFDMASLEGWMRPERAYFFGQVSNAWNIGKRESSLNPFKFEINKTLQNQS